MDKRFEKVTLSRIQAMLSIGLLLLASVKLLAVPATFQYQGHIIVDGNAYQGTGYLKFSLIKNPSTPQEIVLWSNDNPSGTDGIPASSVSLDLTRGVYTVALGDVSLPNMSPIAPVIFNENSLVLRVWFSQDDISFQQLSPDTVIRSVAFAMRAGTVDRVEEAALPSSVSRLLALSEKLTFSAPTATDGPLLAEGYQVFRELEADSWENGPDGAPTVRSDHVGVWSGSEFVIWGGSTSGSRLLGSGAKYDQLANSWESVSVIDAPIARRRHEAVWTGDRMFVWGGHDGVAWNPVGGQYDPRVQKWFPIPKGPLLAREDHVMLWTGKAVLIWGGRHGVGFRGDGALFNPSNNQWTPIPPQGAPMARGGASGVWTGEELVVWGGRLGQGEAGDGGRLTIPDTGPMTWLPVSRENGPSPRLGHTAVWTGDRMIVWGGISGTTPLDDGASYDPVNDLWTRITRIDAPSARSGHSAVWTGKEMVVLFGVDQDGETASAHAYDPITDIWRALPSDGGAEARTGAAVVWTGVEILVFGGEAGGNPLGALQKINPEPPIYLYRKP